LSLFCILHAAYPICDDEHLHDQPLDLELAQIQERTRQFFDRLLQL